MIRSALPLAAVLAAGCPAPSGGGVQQRPRQTEVTLVRGDARPIVDAWAHAVGGRNQIERLGAWHAKGTYTRGGVTGTIETFQSPTGARREITVLGFLREEQVFDGTRGWLVDHNREVRSLAGFELDDQLANAFVGTWSPLVTHRLRGAVSRAGETIVLKPERGNRPDTVTFDPSTHLPVTLVRRDGEKLRTTTWGKWRAVDGVQMPFSMREDNGNPNDTATIEWTSIQHAELDPKLFERPADRASDVTLAAAPITIPIEVVFGGLIFMKVRVNDTPMSFVFDTGAEATILNASRLARLGLAGHGKFATGAGGGDVELSYANGVTTKVGDPKTGEAVVSQQIIAAVNLDALEGPLRRPLDGILGYDFISRFVVEVDYKNQRMRLHDRATYKHTGSGTAQPMTLDESTPFIDASIEVPGNGNIAGRFVLDTGCLCDVQLFAPFVDRLGLLKAFPEAKQLGFSAGAGGETSEVSATIPSLTIGDRVITRPRADFSRDIHGAGADPETAGLIGSVALGHFVLVLDYKHERYYLDPQP